MDDHFAAGVPLHEQHRVTELAAGDAIDREITEESRGAKFGKRVANFCGVETARVVDRGDSEQSGGVRLCRWIVGSVDATGAHPTREVGGRRPKLGMNRGSLFPLRWPDDSFGEIVEVNAEARDTGGDAS